MFNTKYSADTAYQLANQITVEDLETLMAIFNDRIFVYDRSASASVENIDTCINGTSIQINVPASDTWLDELGAD